MKKILFGMFVLLAAIGGINQAGAQAQTCASGAIPCFQGLGTTFTAAAVDSNAVVAGAAGTQAATWMNGTISPLGFLPSCASPCSSTATGISADGSIVAGSSTDSNGSTQAVRWVNGAIAGLGYLPGCTGACSTQASGVSSDGSTVVGWGTISNLTEAFSWSNGSLTVLQLPALTPACGTNGHTCNTQANAVNSTGSVIVGGFFQFPNSPFEQQPITWTNNTGSLLSTQCFEEAARCVATGVSADGSVVIGNGAVKCFIGFCASSEAARWVNGTFSFLGFPGTCSSDSCFSEATGVSSDGMTVVGTGSVGAGDVALVWTPAIGLQSIQTLLAECGGINTTGWRLTGAVTLSPDGKTVAGGVAISADGKTVVGTGVDPSGATESWIARLQFSSCAAVPPKFTFLPTAHDFNGDRKSDILWRDVAGNVGMWLMNGSQISQAATFTNAAPANWSVVGQRDFSGNGNADILWRDTAGDVGIWMMNGAQVLSGSVFGTMPTNWSVAGTGDFNSDGKADILWRDTAGDVGIWFMNGTAIQQQTVTIGNVPTSWIIVGADMNGEIFWRNTSTGEVGIWVVNGSQVTQTVDFGAVPLNWTIAGIGDFDGNNSSDILWRDSSGNVGIWLMNGIKIMSSSVLGNVPANWSIAQTGDYNGDGDTDILWIDTAGNVAAWLMNGTAISSVANFGNVGTAWSVQSLNAE